MAVVRRNILTAPAARDAYIAGVKLLKAEQLGPTTTQLGVAGATRKLSTYDLFVVWHHYAMTTLTPARQSSRNAAHRGPVFAPWHRWMLMLLEQHLQRVLGDPSFGLPYWDWAADGDRTPAQQLASALWAPNCVGGDGSPVASGPFAAHANDPASFRVTVDVDVNNQLRTTNRGLRRQLGADAPSLPKTSQVKAALKLSRFDQAPWSTASAGFRNRLEGWLPASNTANMHNRVHVWVGGDMGPSSSPNDPVFYLNHCNVDRIWSAWLRKWGASYIPDQTAPADLLRHRIDDDMYPLISTPMKPRQMLDVSATYAYDTLPTA